MILPPPPPPLSGKTSARTRTNSFLRVSAARRRSRTLGQRLHRVSRRGRARKSRRPVNGCREGSTRACRRCGPNDYKRYARQRAFNGTPPKRQAPQRPLARGLQGMGRVVPPSQASRGGWGTPSPTGYAVTKAWAVTLGSQRATNTYPKTAGTSCVGASFGLCTGRTSRSFVPRRHMYGRVRSTWTRTPACRRGGSP